MTELLDLSKIAKPRDTIRLPSKSNPDGKSYEILNPSDLGLLEFQKLSALNDQEQKLRALARRSALKPAQKRALRKALGDAIKLLMPSLEPRVLESLPNEAREQILLAWVGKHYQDDGPAAAGAEGKASSRRTTAASSRGSKRSTAATRKAGSTSRRGS